MLSQPAVCRLLLLSQGWLSRLELGKQQPNLETAMRIEKHTGIPLKAWKK